MQELLVIVALLFSLWIVGRMIYRTWFVEDDACAGCPVKKMQD